MVQFIYMDIGITIFFRSWSGFTLLGFSDGAGILISTGLSRELHRPVMSNPELPASSSVGRS